MSNITRQRVLLFLTELTSLVIRRRWKYIWQTLHITS